MCSTIHFVTNTFNRMMIHVAMKSQAFGCHRGRPGPNSRFVGDSEEIQLGIGQIRYHSHSVRGRGLNTRLFVPGTQILRRVFQVPNLVLEGLFAQRSTYLRRAGRSAQFW
jgi:hypothetical protein